MEEDILYNEIHKRQEILDKKWRHGHYFINGHFVSQKEYWDYMEEQRLADAKLDAEISFYRRSTSTGEEWEVDSDGEYTPDWLYDRL